MKRSHINLNKIVTIFILFIGILLTMSLIRNINTIMSANTKIQDAADKLTQLKNLNQKLKDQVAEVNSPAFNEKLARDELGLAASGEAVAVLPDEDILRKLSPLTHDDTSGELPKPIWQKWLDLFF